jgi:GTP-binding protein
VGALNNKDTPKLVVVDAPGYGERGRPEWGDLVNDYVENRPKYARVLFAYSDTRAYSKS